MDKLSSEKINVLKSKNIFFGHRSVGENIIQGVKSICAEDTHADLKISKLSDTNDYTSNYFVDSNIGYNGDPKSKFDEFSRIVNKLSMDKKLNIAMMKLCYADITKDTNVDEVFENYAIMIDSLLSKYPDIHIIHFTVPLTAEQSWFRKIKSWIKGTSKNNALNNVARMKYNELLASYYPKDQIFDLAGIESTYPDGSREKEIIDGKLYYSLIKEYTVDGGHLNQIGQNIAAAKFINFLADYISTYKQNKLSKK